MKTKFHLSMIAYVFAALLGSIFVLPASAQDAEINITVKDKKFDPATINVPANKPFKLIVQNSDSVSIEIESHKPRFEKVVSPGSKAIINMKPLEPGTYSFYDDFNKSNKGEIIAK
jgi:cupredoxin-like protein